MQRAQEGWRRRATTVGPAMTKSAAQGSATAARSSSGRAASCARPADTARNAEVPRPGGAGAPPAGQGSADLTPSRHRLIRPQRQRALLVCRAQLREYFTVLGDAEVVMNPVQKEDMLGRDLGHVRQKQREGILHPPIPNQASQSIKKCFRMRNTLQKCPGERTDGVLWVQRLLLLCEGRV